MPKLSDLEKRQTRMALQYRPPDPGRSARARESHRKAERKMLATALGIPLSEVREWADLAIANERRRCAAICERLPDNLMAQHLRKLILEAT